MTTVLIVLILGIVVTTVWRKTDIFHPSKIYVIVYALLFSVYSLHLCRFQNPWSSTTMMLFWGGVLAFLGAGALVTFYVKHLSLRFSKTDTLVTVSHQLKAVEDATDWKWFFNVTLIIFILFTGSYLYNFLNSGIIPMFSEDPNDSRFIYLQGSYFIAIAGASGTLVMMLCAELLFVKKVTARAKWAAAIMLLISFLLYFSFVTRMPLVRTFIYMVVIRHYLQKQISLRSILLTAVAIVVFFLVGMFIRVDVAEFSTLALHMRIDLPPQYIAFVNPYAYAANNVWNMDFAFRKYVDGFYACNFTYGFELFRAIFFYANIEGLFQSIFGFDSLTNESIIKVRGLNTVIYLWHFYKDFGAIGLFFISFAFGTIVHLFYYNVLLIPSHLRTTLFALIISMIVFSFMVPLWSFWNLYYEAGILILAHKTLRIV